MDRFGWQAPTARVDRQTPRRAWCRVVGPSPDGKRVVVTPVESAEAPKQDHEIVMLLNFADELRRKVPVGK